MEIKAEVGSIDDKLLTAAADFLRANGWKVLVIGGTMIRGPIEAEYRYELGIVFVGKKRAEKGVARRKAGR